MAIPPAPWIERVIVSDKPAAISEFRKIQIAVKRPGLSVNARDRYWAGPSGQAQ